MSQYYSNPYTMFPNISNGIMPPRGMSANNIMWVQGHEGAKSYIIPANSNVILLDSEEEGKMYIKSSDNIGMCTLRTFMFNEIIDVEPSKEVNTQQYATKQDLQEIREMINSLKGGKNEQFVQPIKSNKPNNADPRK